MTTRKRQSLQIGGIVVHAAVTRDGAYTFTDRQLARMRAATSGHPVDWDVKPAACRLKLLEALYRAQLKESKT